jgi:AcrR family transcriptional regulator
MNVHLVSFAVGMERRAERKAETRERIVRAFLKRFVSPGGGYKETSIKKLADEAGVSLGALYVHFPEGKQQLAEDLFDQGWNGIGEGMRSCARKQPLLSGKIRAIVEYVFRRYDEDPELVSYVFRNRHEHLKKLPASRGNPYTVFRLIIADAARRGEIPSGDLEIKTSLIVGAIVQAVDSAILSRIKGSLSDSAKVTADCCVRMLGAE